jgi:hypothetical protein
MRTCLTVLLLAVLTAPGARGGQEIPVELDVNLAQPSSTRPWINVKDCMNPAEFDLAISWSLSEAPVMWVTPLEADVFLSTSDSCSVSVEIGDTESDGYDVMLDPNTLSGDFPLEGDELTLAHVTGLDCSGGAEADYYFCIKWTYTYTEYVTEYDYVFRGGAPIRFDVSPPTAPELISVSPGEKNLKLKWDPPRDSGGSQVDDIMEYEIYYRAEGSDEVKNKTLTNGEASDYQLTGLSNGVAYEVWIAAVDEARNEGAESNRLVGTPEPVEDFYEHYKDAGGSEEGGFCFVATAAFGSYQAAMVRPLRVFRDSVLMASAAGRELVSGYYRYGPRWARAIRDSDTHRAVARWALLPAVAAAEAGNRLGTGEWLVLLGAALILVMLLSRFVRRRLLRAGKLFLPLVLAVVVLGSAESARAQVSSVPDFQLQIRLGPYYPDVDQEDGLVGEPFRDVYGSGSEVLFELGIDYELWQVFGTVTVGGSFGFVQYLGKAMTQSGEQATDTTVFNIVPFRLSLGYHFDVLAKEYGIPLVPYLGGGLSYYVWWALDGVGDVCEWENAEGDSFSASGGIFGLHFFGGLKLLLDVLDPEAATNFEAQVGVINTYFFAEYAVSWVDGFGSDSHMDLSNANFMFGLMMEF